MKIFIFPVNSLILSDIIERFGHIPLTMMGEIKSKGMRSQDQGTKGIYEPRKGLKYTPVEVPSGVRGRLALIGTLVEDADAAIIMEDADFGFGCGGCARANEVVPYIVAQQGIPLLKVMRPTNLDEAKLMVRAIKEFLLSLEG